MVRGLKDSLGPKSLILEGLGGGRNMCGREGRCGKVQRLTAKDAESAKEMREFGTADERR